MPDEKRSRIHPAIRRRARELRQPQTPAEARLWQWLRGRNLDGHYFRRQHPIGSFIVDFCCVKAWLVVEVDGDVHTEQVAYDAARSDWLAEQGYRVIRYSNAEVFSQLELVLDDILSACGEQSADAGESPSLEGGDRGG